MNIQLRAYLLALILLSPSLTRAHQTKHTESINTSTLLVITAQISLFAAVVAYNWYYGKKDSHHEHSHGNGCCGHPAYAESSGGQAHHDHGGHGGHDGADSGCCSGCDGHDSSDHSHDHSSCSHDHDDHSDCGHDHSDHHHEHSDSCDHSHETHGHSDCDHSHEHSDACSHDHPAYAESFQPSHEAMADADGGQVSHDDHAHCDHDHSGCDHSHTAEPETYEINPSDVTLTDDSGEIIEIEMDNGESMGIFAPGFGSIHEFMGW